MEQQPVTTGGTSQEQGVPPYRKSFEYFHQLKTELLADIGISENESMVLWSMTKIFSDLGNLKTIEEAIARRKTSLSKRARNLLADRFRRKDTDFMSTENSFPKEYRPEIVDQYKTSALKKWKERILANLQAFEQYRPLFELLHDVELHPEIRSLLEKYGKTKVSELLEPGLSIEYKELEKVSFRLQGAIEFRNRKISELLAYRYARTFSADGSVEDFVKDTHRLVDGFEDDKGKNEGFRSYKLERSFGQVAGAFDGFPHRTIPFAIEQLKQMIDEVPQSSDRAHIQKEALKYYLIFEIIHPFSDGNGRTGRALFTYLQRKFVDKSLSRSAPLHIPIARLESGTSNPQMVDGVYEEARLGSLSLDVSNLFKKISTNQFLRDLSIRLHDSFTDLLAQTRTRKVTQGEVSILVRAQLIKLNELFSTPEMDGVLDQMLSVIEKQSAEDDLNSQDWKIVSEALEKRLGTVASQSIGVEY